MVRYWPCLLLSLYLVVYVTTILFCAKLKSNFKLISRSVLFLHNRHSNHAKYACGLRKRFKSILCIKSILCTLFVIRCDSSAPDRISLRRRLHELFFQRGKKNSCLHTANAQGSNVNYQSPFLTLFRLRRRLHELFHPGMSFTPG